MKILCVFGEHNYGNPSRGASYEYSNFLPALQRLGHEVELFESFDRSKYTSFTELNRALLEKVTQFHPDVLFCVFMGYEVWLETLALIGNSGVCLVGWGADDSWKYEQSSRFLAPYFDLWVTTSHDAWYKAQQEELTNFVLSQWAANAEMLQVPLPAKACRYQITFVGSAYGNRPKLIAALGKLGIAVECFGYGWPNGPVSAQDIPRIFRESKISLNFGDSGIQFRGLLPYRSRQIKARTFEVPGAGGCLLTEAADHLDRYFIPGKEIEIFSGINDLHEKIRHLLAHPEQRDAIAFAGFSRTRAEHTYEMRFDEILRALPPVSHVSPIDSHAFLTIAERHRVGCFLNILRVLIILPFQLIWGRTRGRRAARRALFELSWRWGRGKTYTASGLPGRLFYEES